MVRKLNIHNNIYVNVEIIIICLFLKSKVLHEYINIDLTAKMVQHNNTLRTYLVQNHKAKVLSQRTFAIWRPKF